MEKIITKNLLPGRSYRVRATGVDSDGKTITSQVYILKTKGKSQAPPNVSNLSADFKGKTLVVTWNGDAARAEKDFKHFRIKLTSTNHPGITKNYYTDSNVFKFQEDQNRDAFGSYEGNLSITVYSLDRTGNQSSGVTISASSEPPDDPTNAKLSAAPLGYNVSWDLPTFPNYYGTRIYQSDTQNGTYVLVKTEYGSATFVDNSTFTEVWVKVAHINSAGVESNRVAPTPPNVTPIDPVGANTQIPADPTNLNWEDPESDALNTLNGITTASKRGHWQVSEITSGYKVRVSENGQNWAVYDVPAIKATITHKSSSGTTATLTVTANSFAVNDYITVFGLGAPFDGKFKITSRTNTSVSYTLPSSYNLSSTADDGEAILSSYIVKELNPGTLYYASILAYNSANNLSQFVSEGTFTTAGTVAQLGSAIKIGGTTMAFGPAAGGSGNNGLYINSSNYWYTTGSFKVGTTGNSMTWDGVKLSLDGGISARSGIFSGNVFIANGNASLIAADSITVQSGTWSSGVATITLGEPVPGSWVAGNMIVIAQTGSSFDGQYLIQGTPSGSNLSFSMPSAPTTYPVFNSGAVSNVSVGDRVVFNDAGISGYSGGTAKFTLERGGSLTIIDIVARGIRLFGGGSTHSVTNFGPVRYSIFSDDGKDLLLKGVTSPPPGESADPAKIRWLDSASNQRGTIGFDAAGVNANKFVIRSFGLSTPNNGNMLIDAGDNGVINLRASAINGVLINGDPIETSSTIANRYKNGINSPSDGNKITFSSAAPATSASTNRGDIHLRYA